MITPNQTNIKTLSASQVKNTFGTIVSQVRNGQYDTIIVENHGEPVVAIIAVKELQGMSEFREKKRREEALRLLREARVEAQAQIKGKLTSEEVEKIANRFSRELIEDLEKEGKVRFERKSS